MSYSRLDNDRIPRETDDLSDAFADSDDEDVDDRRIHISRSTTNPRYQRIGPQNGNDTDVVGELAGSSSESLSASGMERMEQMEQDGESRPSDQSRTSHVDDGAGGRGLFNFFSRRRLSGFSSNANGNSNNDGVFANLTAKPDTSEKPSDEEPPSYEEAAADATPPYWETTIMSPGYGDEMLIDGLPVGSPINFIWNMMVSAAFQFVGFFLTYLLHTSHAAKQGSRAGLGFTLLQCGYYLQPDMDVSEPSTMPPKFEPSDPNDVDVTSHGTVSGTFVAGHNIPQASTTNVPDNSSAQTNPASNYISLALIFIGIILVVKAITDYILIKRMQTALMRSSGEVPIVIEPTDSDTEDRIIMDMFPGALFDRTPNRQEREDEPNSAERMV